MKKAKKNPVGRDFNKLTVEFNNLTDKILTMDPNEDSYDIILKRMKEINALLTEHEKTEREAAEKERAAKNDNIKTAVVVGGLLAGIALHIYDQKEFEKNLLRTQEYAEHGVPDSALKLIERDIKSPVYRA